MSEKIVTRIRTEMRCPSCKRKQEGEMRHMQVIKPVTPSSPAVCTLIDVWVCDTCEDSFALPKQA